MGSLENPTTASFLRAYFHWMLTKNFRDVVIKIFTSKSHDEAIARDPWASDKITQTDWNLGLSHKNRKNELSPSLYFPVLGEPKSRLGAGETVRYQFRYHLNDQDWFAVMKHAAYAPYRFRDGLVLRQTRQSLCKCVERMHRYLTDPVTSLWNVEAFQGLKIGGQSYLGGVEHPGGIVPAAVMEVRVYAA